MHVANSLALFYSQVSFYIVSKSLVILFTLLPGVWTKKSLSGQTPGVCALIAIGFFLTTLTEYNMSWQGFWFSILSGVFAVIYGFSVRSIVPILQDDYW